MVRMLLQTSLTSPSQSRLFISFTATTIRWCPVARVSSWKKLSKTDANVTFITVQGAGHGTGFTHKEEEMAEAFFEKQPEALTSGSPDE